MALVTITIRDAPGANLEITVKAVPGLPLKDGDLDVDSPDCTPAMAASVAASQFLAEMGSTWEQHVAETSSHAEHIHRTARRAREQ